MSKVSIGMRSFPLFLIQIMRRTLLLLFIFESTYTYSQIAYQSVIEARTAFYQGAPSGYYADSGQIYAIRIDSSENLGTEKKLFQYSQLNNSDPYCLGSSWVGSEIIVCNDGWNFFLAENSYFNVTDTFQLQTLSSVGTVNFFHRFYDSTYLEATCTSLDYELVLGDLDSVRTFSLQKKNMDGTDATSTWNTREIKLSKSKGLIEYFNLQNASPDYAPEVINLIGFTNPSQGYQPPSSDSIFDFSVGAEFQFTNVQPWWYGSWSNSYTKKIILDKSESANGDTLIYTVSRYGVTLSWYNFQPSDTTLIADTIIEKYVKHHYFIVDSPPFKFQLSLYPNEYDPNFFYLGGFHETFRTGFCKRDIIRTPTYFLTDSNGCLNDLQCFGICWIYEFVPHLGVVGFYSADLPDYGEFLTYYNDGNDSCGAPINFGVWLGDNASSLANKVEVFPNPARDQLWIQVTNQIDLIVLMDELGIVRKKISREEISPEKIGIVVSELPSGIYFLRISSGANVFLKKIVIEK